MNHASLAEQIDALLPQTQCTQCGYDGCMPYARAIAIDGEEINRCPPGGQAGMHALAQLLGRTPVPLNPECGTPKPLHVALIDEAHCIGCTLCIQACPVDAIVGANKLMHTVVPDLCTGCDLCVAPCPVDCISMVPANNDWTPERASQARDNHRNRQARLTRLHAENTGPAARTLANKAPVAVQAATDPQRKQQAITDALERARQRRAAQAARNKTP
jgi:electron transport complex protein RnfB